MNETGTPIVVAQGRSTTLSRIRDLPERWLQELIHKHPNCLPMDDIEPGIGRLVPVCMELPLRVGSVDNLLITPEGNLVVVEVKLWSNPEARRAVVAQALDYAVALFQLDYLGLQAAVKKADFSGVEPPDRLYSLVEGADVLSEPLFADRITNNLRTGRIVVLVVGDDIRREADELVAGLQAHANFHFTFALIEMPVYSKGQLEAADEFIVMPRTLVKTVTVPRFTIRTKGGKTTVSDAGTEESEATKPSRRSTISSEEFFAKMAERGPDVSNRLKRFVDEVAAIDVRPEYRESLNLKWDQPEGRPVNLGYITPGGEIWTEASNWQVEDNLAYGYNQRLAELFGGEIRTGRQRADGGANRWVIRGDGRPFRIEDVVQRLSDWVLVILDFQNAVRQQHAHKE